MVIAGIENGVDRVSGAPEGKMLVAEVAGGHRDCGEDSSREIGGGLAGAEAAAQEQRERRQQQQVEEHAGAVDRDATQPFTEVMAAGVENKPFVAEKGDGDGDDAAEEARDLRSVDAVPAQEVVDGDEERVAEAGIEGADQKITEDLRELRPLGNCTHVED